MHYTPHLITHKKEHKESMPVKDGFFFKCSMGNFCNMLTRTKGSNFFVTSGRDESIILYTKIKLDRMEMAGIFFFTIHGH